MRIASIRIEGFRKLIEPVSIEGLAPGLNVIAGDNEEGKSTVLEALLAVFFNRHRLTGRDADAMQPFGHRGRPRIAVTFAIGEDRYRLTKAFCQKPEAVLETPGGHLRDDAAEEALQELLRYDPPGRSGARAEHRGMMGLFWVEQGTSFLAPEVVRAARGTLMGALEQEVGDVLGGERGHRLLRTFEARLSTYFTATGRPRGPLADAEKCLAEAKEKETGLRQRYERYEHEVDRLGQIRATLRAYREERRLEAARERLQVAEAACAELNRLQARLQEALQERRLAEVEVERAAERHKGRTELAEQLAGLEKTRAERAGEEGQLAQELEAAERAATAMAERHAEATRACGLVESELQQAEALERALRLRAELRALEERLAKATAAKETADRARARAAAIKVDDKLLAGLRKLEQAATAARGAVESAATRIDLAPEAGRKALVEGAAAPARLDLAEPTRIELPGWGALTVTPGGEELAPRRERLREAQAALAEALVAGGVDSLAAAETRHDERRRLLADAETEARIAAEHAPEGTEVLVERRLALAAELEGLPATEAPVNPQSPQTRVAEVRLRLEEARRLQDEARGRAESAAADAHRARAAWTAVRSRLEGVAEESARVAARLSAARTELPDEALEEAVVQARRRHGEALSRKEEVEAALEALNPEAIQLEERRCRDAVEAIVGDLDRLEREAEGLARELQGLGADGLAEELAEAAGAREAAEADAARVRQDALALRLLHRTLAEAEREAKERFFEPVRARLAPYVRLLFPQVELLFDQEGLSPTHLRRGGQEEPFEALSVGTREQLAVLTRLAFAELLAEHGHPALVILDDALVFADHERFGRMLLALRRAEQRGLQVLVLTCRERDYQGLGAPLVRLRDCRAEESRV